MSAFSDFVDSSTPTTRALPLAHNCDSYHFREIAKSQQLRPSFCGHFKEDLIYLFYGRPAYRTNAPSKAT